MSQTFESDKAIGEEVTIKLNKSHVEGRVVGVSFDINGKVRYDIQALPDYTTFQRVDSAFIGKIRNQSKQPELEGA